MSLTSSYLRKILRELKYKTLDKLINREVEIYSIETIESDIFSILGGDLPNESRLIYYDNDKRYFEGAIAKYGIIDAKFSVSIRRLASCSQITRDDLRELYFIEEADSKTNKSSENSNDLECLDVLVEDIDKNEAFIKLFMKAKEIQNSNSFREIPQSYFPKKFVIQDACLTNSGFVWINKHFYL